MIHTSKPIVFFGTEDFSLVSLRALIDDGFNVVAVVTKPDSRKGRGHNLTEPPVKTLAIQHTIPVLQPRKLSEIIPFVETLDYPVGVLVSYGKIIPQNIIDLFTPGIINVHPSLLPLYRGPSPIEAAILHGDQETGVSLMKLASKMDAGPVYATIIYKLAGDETKPQLYQDLAKAGANLLTSLLPDIIDGSLRPVRQNDSDATYCQLLTKADAQLDPGAFDATQAERHVRAYLNFPKTKLTVNSQDIVIIKAHVSDVAKTNLDIVCRDGSYLCIDRLIAPSGSTMSVEEYLRGYAA